MNVACIGLYPDMKLDKVKAEVEALDQWMSIASMLQTTAVLAVFKVRWCAGALCGSTGSADCEAGPSRAR